MDRLTDRALGGRRCPFRGGGADCGPRRRALPSCRALLTHGCPLPSSAGFTPLRGESTLPSTVLPLLCPQSSLQPRFVLPRAALSAHLGGWAELFTRLLEASSPRAGQSSVPATALMLQVCDSCPFSAVGLDRKRPLSS